MAEEIVELGEFCVDSGMIFVIDPGLLEGWQQMADESGREYKDSSYDDLAKKIGFSGWGASLLGGVGFRMSGDGIYKVTGVLVTSDVGKYIKEVRIALR